MGRKDNRSLTSHEERRIMFAMRDQLSFFAPTISPAPKCAERQEIESLEAGIRYYFERGCNRVLIQPKYMGSYCDIYLERDIEKTRFFSRKGFPVRLPREKMIAAIGELHSKLLERYPNFDMIMVQSELMPWSALGKHLVDFTFGSYETSHRSHLEHMKSSGIRGIIDEDRADPRYQKFLSDSQTMERKDLKAKYAQHEVSHYEALRDIDMPEVESYEKNLNLFKEQLDLYGAEGEIHFKPFNILKIHYVDGTEEIPDDHSLFTTVSDDLEVPFEVDALMPDVEGQIEAAYRYYRMLVDDDKMEGVIIKPLDPIEPTTAPMFKVRNDRYLQLVYGVNYQQRFDYYFERRNTQRKMRASCSQWAIAQAVLKIPRNEISEENEEYARLVRSRIYEEDFEKVLDSRL